MIIYLFFHIARRHQCRKGLSDMDVVVVIGACTRISGLNIGVIPIVGNRSKSGIPQFRFTGSHGDYQRLTGECLAVDGHLGIHGIGQGIHSGVEADLIIPVCAAIKTKGRTGHRRSRGNSIGGDGRSRQVEQ